MALTDGFTPKLIFLSESDKERIFETALQVIEEIGMAVLHPDALTLLKEAGCTADDDGIVKIPSSMVKRAIESAPGNIAIYDRDGNLAMDLGGRRAYFGTGSDLMYAVESENMTRHKTGLEDVKLAARVCDALPNIDFIMSCAHPHELEPSRAYLESFKAMVENSKKPIVTTAENRGDLSRMWEISKVLRGGEQALREKPLWIHYAEPISPLKHPVPSVDKLIFCAETGMPAIYSPAPIAGSTAPITLAGHVVQGLAESLFGLVIHQLTAEGAPFLMGMGAAVLDMSTSQCSYNAPEYLMAYMAMVEMSHHLDLPNWGYAGTSDAQIPDGQATYEAGLLTYMSTLAGSNLNHDVGYLNFGLSGSLEMVVIMDEVIDQIRRMQRGIAIDDDQLALDVIREGARVGEFLTHNHTFAHLHDTQWRPNLISRDGYENWEAGGRTSILDRARGKLQEIVENHQPDPIAAAKASEIDKTVSQFGS
jgi:trimethylamine---corrinoid protein Co-methyltransferase